MKIFDTKGNELTTRPDYNNGRLLQSPDNPENYIYTTWDEVPPGDGNGEIPKTKEEKIYLLDTKYAEDKDTLLKEYSDAMMHDDTETAEELKEELMELDEWYDTEYRKLTSDTSET